MDDSQAAGGPGDGGVSAVLYGMFTSFTEALDAFDRRLAAIEAALAAGPGEMAGRLARIEEAVTAAPAPGDRSGDSELAGRVGRIEDILSTAGPVLVDLGPTLLGVADRLDRIEASVRDPAPGVTDMGTSLSDVARRLEGLEQAVAAAGAAGDAGAAAVGAPADHVRRQVELIEARTAALTTAVQEIHLLVRAHVDETAHSLSRRAGEAGRRLANDLGLRARPRPEGGQRPGGPASG